MKRTLWITAAVLAIAPLAVHGCTAMKPGEDHRLIALTTIDSGADPPPCAHRRVPPRPNVTGRGGSLDLVFVVQSSYSGTSSYDDAGAPAYESIGFDLDNTCTGEGQGPSCVEPLWANADDHHDGKDGIDNAFGRLLFNGMGPPDRVTVDATSAVIMTRVRGYSGEADDDQVEVSAYVGYGLSREDGQRGPLWDGQDRWSILPETLVPLGDAGATYSVDQPRFRDPNAYVSDWVLVTHFAEALSPNHIPSAPTALIHVVQTVGAVRLVRAGDAGERWEGQDGVVGGRQSVTDALHVLARLPSQSDPNQPLCQSKSEYEHLKRTLCSIVDITSGPDSPASTCDAFSSDFAFQGKQALLGVVASPPPLLARCAPDVHPETDTCDSLLADH